MLKNILKKAIKFFCLVMIMALLNLIAFLIIFYTITTPIYIQENNIVQECGGDIMQEIEQVAINISNHTFIKGSYDCTQFSEDLVKQLKNINVSAYCVEGFIKDNSIYYSHIWVEVIINNKIYPIEATDGTFILNDYYKENYKIMKKGFCI